MIVQRAQDARNGEIVVALAGDDESLDEATVKTFYREKNGIRLQPENASMEPITLAARAGASAASWGSSGSYEPRTSPRSHRTLDQELVALLRGASLECLTCGEFVMHARGGVFCPECGASSATRTCSRQALRFHRAGRVTAVAPPSGGAVEESPDTAGQDARARPGGESRRKVEQKGHRLRRISGDAGGKGETVG